MNGIYLSMDSLPHTGPPPAVIAYCGRCQEQLIFMGRSTCPVCKLEYDTERPETFLSKPSFLWWKYWFPGLFLAVASGVISYSVCMLMGELGFALFVAVPVSMGAILGFATRIHIWALAFLGLTLIGSVVFALISMEIAGLFCGFTLALIFLVPTSCGMALGWVLRVIIKQTAWDQRRFLPLALLVLIPYATQALENTFPRREQLTTVRTELNVDATAREAWNAIMFYEEVEHQPPWLLRMALPRPVRSVGDKQTEGGIVRCYYERGQLVKRISRRVEDRLLAFDVVDQQLHFERDVTLKDGSFRLVPGGGGRTRIVLTTRYVRQLAPRWLWEPIEHQVVHSLHGHVLEGMRRAATGEPVELRQRQPAPYEPSPPLAPRRLAAVLDVPSWREELER